MKSTYIKNGYSFTIYTAKNPFKKLANGAGIYAQIIVWNDSRIGRVLYDRQTIIK
jgi:hypothetical protein